MMTQAQLDKIKTPQACDIEISAKVKLRNECVGWLYASILQSEIEQLSEHYMKLVAETRKPQFV